MLLAVMELGGAGVISVSSHLVGHEMAAIAEDVRPRRPRRRAAARRRPGRALRGPVRDDEPHPHQGRARDDRAHPLGAAAAPAGRGDAGSARHPAHRARAPRHPLAGLTASDTLEADIATDAAGARVRVIPLGGAGEIGKNMYVVESDGRMVVIDCGITFPKNDQMGVDIVLPDFTYLLERPEALEAIILTHGHEDHIGAVPFLLRAVGQVPVYGRRFTLALLRPKLGEHGLRGERRADRGALRARGRGRALRRRVHPASRTRCRTARPSRCGPRRARSCTPATSASSSTRSTAASAPSRTSCGWATGACGCCWPTRRTPRRATSRSRSPTTPSRTGSRPSSPRPAGGCS